MSLYFFFLHFRKLKLLFTMSPTLLEVGFVLYSLPELSCALLSLALLGEWKIFLANVDLSVKGLRDVVGLAV